MSHSSAAVGVTPESAENCAALVNSLVHEPDADWSHVMKGIIYPTPPSANEIVDVTRELSAEALNDMVTQGKFEGLSMIIEHDPNATKDNRIGRVIRASINPQTRNVEIEFRLRRDPKGGDVVSRVQRGELAELSLGHVYMNDTGATRALEVSLCSKGARPGCKIIRASARLSAGDHVQASATAPAATAAPASTTTTTAAPAAAAVTTAEKPADAPVAPDAKASVATDAVPMEVVAEAPPQPAATEKPPAGAPPAKAPPGASAPQPPVVPRPSPASFASEFYMQMYGGATVGSGARSAGQPEAPTGTSAPQAPGVSIVTASDARGGTVAAPHAAAVTPMDTSATQQQQQQAPVAQAPPMQQQAAQPQAQQQQLQQGAPAAVQQQQITVMRSAVTGQFVPLTTAPAAAAAAADAQPQAGSQKRSADAADLNSPESTPAKRQEPADPQLPFAATPSAAPAPSADMIAALTRIASSLVDRQQQPPQVAAPPAPAPVAPAPQPGGLTEEEKREREELRQWREQKAREEAALKAEGARRLAESIMAHSDPSTAPVMQPLVEMFGSRAFMESPQGSAMLIKASAMPVAQRPQVAQHAPPAPQQPMAPTGFHAIASATSSAAAAAAPAAMHVTASGSVQPPRLSAFSSHPLANQREVWDSYIREAAAEQAVGFVRMMARSGVPIEMSTAMAAGAPPPPPRGGFRVCASAAATQGKDHPVDAVREVVVQSLDNMHNRLKSLKISSTRVMPTGRFDRNGKQIVMCPEFSTDI